MASLFEQFKKEDWFKPESFLLFYSIFILLAGISFRLKIVKAAPGTMGLFVVLFGFAFFLIGTRFAKIFHSIKISKFFPMFLILFLTIFYTFVLNGFYKIPVYYALPLCAIGFIGIYYAFKMIIKGEINFKKFFRVSLIVSLVVFPLGFAEIGGIPIFNLALRPLVLKSTFAGISFLLFLFAYSMLLPQIKRKQIAYLIIIISTLLFSLFAFRSIILIIFLGGVFVLYYNKYINKQKIAVSFLAALLIIVLLGYYFRPLLPPFQLLLYRAGTTFLIFDKIIAAAFPFGLTQGTLFFQGDVGAVVAQMFFNKEASLTSTFIGPAFLDLGFIGVAIWMFFQGLILKLSYISKNIPILKGFYPMLFALSLVMIELGINQLYMLLFFLFLMFYFVKKEDMPTQNLL